MQRAPWQGEDHEHDFSGTGGTYNGSVSLTLAVKATYCANTPCPFARIDEVTRADGPAKSVSVGDIVTYVPR